MAGIRSFATRLRNKLKQQDIEENDPSSLVAKAFRRRLLEEETVNSNPAVPSSLATVNSARVAVYTDKSSNLRRRFSRILLGFVAPLLAILLILVIVFTIVNTNKPVVVFESESIALDNVPVPAGVRPIQRAKQLNLKPLVETYFYQFIPNYGVQYKSSASYISPKPLPDLQKYYASKFVETKPTPWQVWGKPAYFGNTFITLYLRSLNNQGAIEGIMVQLEPVDKEILKRDPGYYDEKAQPGETVMVLSKAWAAPR